MNWDDAREVHSQMVAAQHKWAVGKGVMRVPTPEEIRDVADSLEVSLRSLLGNKSVASGGLFAEWVGDEVVVSYQPDRM